jgi:hypothetical protein
MDQSRLLCALVLLANDLLFTALNAVFCGAVLDLTFGRFWTGALGYGLVLRTASRDAFAATCSR